MRFSRMIGSRVHGMMDYPMGALMMSSPLLFRADRKDIATWLPVAIGASTAVVAAMTNFEAGVKRKIPFRTHLLIDMISGAALALSPLLFGTRRRQWIPHLLFGVSELVTAMLTRPRLDERSSSSSGAGTGKGSTSRSRRSKSSSSNGSSSSRGSSRSGSRSNRGSESRSSGSGSRRSRRASTGSSSGESSSE